MINNPENITDGDEIDLVEQVIVKADPDDFQEQEENEFVDSYVGDTREPGTRKIGDTMNQEEHQFVDSYVGETGARRTGGGTINKEENEFVESYVGDTEEEAGVQRGIVVRNDLLNMESVAKNQGEKHIVLKD